MKWLALLFAGCVTLPLPKLVDDGARRSLVPASGASAGLDFTVTSLPAAKPYSVSSDRGSVVLIDVWATWCDPCRESLPFYADVARQFEGRGLKVYALSIDAESNGIAPFLKELGVALPVLHDPEAGVIGPVIQLRQVPTSVLFDRSGRIRRVHEGLSDDFFQQTLSDVEALLAEK